MYIPPKTKEALAKRAMGLARTLELWKREMLEEMKKQNVDYSPQFGEPSTMQLDRRFVRVMIGAMVQAADEIRRLETSVQKHPFRRRIP